MAGVKDTILNIIILLLLLLLCWQAIKEPKFLVREIQKQDTIIVRDTVRIEARGKIVYRTKYKYVQSQDSAQSTTTGSEIDSSSFTVCLDTTVAKTMLNVCYFYPENKFMLNIQSQPDTITKYTVIEKPIIKYEQRKDNWTIDLLKIGSGMILGFMLGKIK
ncbi:hypothetical protein D9V84_11170 [Bacteroidetes/Chlorobi group bacterium Naka2016]|jgi:hypothetical protein|nr:MAG: hypothetical protein D9V84_11170 [Bacteroidetes/Chlorobi group bacterium Naka2016]